MHLHQAIGWPGPITWRQYLAWQDWLVRELNNPGLTEHYLMALTAEVRRSWVKDPRSVDLASFNLQFKDPRKNVTPALTREQATTFAKTKWLGMMTAPVTGPDGKPIASPFTLR